MDENQRPFQVDLTLTGDKDKELRALTDRIRQETFPDSSGWYRLGMLLLKMGQSDKAQQVCQVLLDQATNESEKEPIYNQIGWAKAMQGEYKEAITFYEKSIEIKQKTIPLNHFNLASSYSNIGLVYDNMGEYSKALLSHEKSLKIEEQSLPPNHPHFASSYGNIGLLHEKMDDYSKARSFYKRAVNIAQQSLPSNHPDLQKHRNNLDRIKKKL